MTLHISSWDFLQMVFAFYDMLLDFDILAPVRGIQNAYFVGTFGLIVCMFVYLARDLDEEESGNLF